MGQGGASTGLDAPSFSCICRVCIPELEFVGTADVGPAHQGRRCVIDESGTFPAMLEAGVIDALVRGAGSRLVLRCGRYAQLPATLPIFELTSEWAGLHT